MNNLGQGQVHPDDIKRNIEKVFSAARPTDGW